MPIGLSVFVRRFFLDEKSLRRELTQPVLIWDRRDPTREVNDEFSHLTELMTEFENTMEAKSMDEMFPTRVAVEPLVFILGKSAKGDDDNPLEITVGRTPQNDLVFHDSSVSRVHAGFRQEAASGAWNLIDKGSSNGTWVGSTRLAPHQPSRIPDRSYLRFGSVELLFLLPASFHEHLRERAPELPRDRKLGPAEQTPEPQGAEAPHPGDPERPRVEFALTLRDLDALLDFYRETMKIYEAYGAQAGRDDQMLAKGYERATSANEVLTRLLVAAQLRGT